MRQRFSTFLALTVLLGGTLVAGGCDFQRVDEGADRSLSSIMTDLSEADTPAKAEAAIDLMLQKTEIGVAYKAGMYDGYQFTGGDVRRLAQAQAAFNESMRSNPDDASSVTLESVYEEVLGAQERLKRQELSFRNDRAIQAGLSEVLEVLDVTARYAMHNPEKPEHSMLLTISSDPLAVSPGVSTISADRTVSPLQRMLFGVWLHKNGPNLDLALAKAGNPNEACPDGTSLIAKFNWSGGAYVFEKPEGNEGVVVITNGSTSSGNWTSSQDIDAIVLKGGTATKVDVPADPNSGSFNNSGLVNNGGRTAGISNIKFCGSEEPGDPFEQCLDECEERRQICLLGGGECEGGIAVLRLKFLGDSDTDVTVERSPNTVGLFDDTLSPGEEFTLDGTGINTGPQGHRGTIKTNVYFYVNGERVDAIHTSCSDPRVKPGFVSDGGLFEVLEVIDKDGTNVGEAGDPEICEIEYQNCVDGCHDQGGGN